MRSKPRMAAATPALPEAAFQRRVTDLCDVLRLRWHHETDSRRSRAGFPDLVICGPGGVAFVELKAEGGRLSDEQIDWLTALRTAGQAAYVWRPSNWDDALSTLRALARPPITVLPAKTTEVWPR